MLPINWILGSTLKEKPNRREGELTGKHCLSMKNIKNPSYRKRKKD